jgi:arylsulfatase
MPEARQRPNVIVIMSDEQRWDALGHTGGYGGLVTTPHIDGLAARGASMDACFAAYPLCCPSRMSVWTGLMPHAHRGFGNWRLLREDLRDGGLVHPFADAGYHTIYNGKWHVPGPTPARFGFADVAAVPAVLDGHDRGRYIEPYREYATAQGYELLPGNIENLTAADEAQLHRAGKGPYGTSSIALEHYLEPWQTCGFLEQLERRPEGEPFFAVCSFNAPHFPMIVPAPYDRLVDPDSIELPPNFCAGLKGKPGEVVDSPYHEDLSEPEWRRLIAHYLGFCALIDNQVGAILGYLEAEGQRDETIVVFASDHGDMMGSHGLNKKGYPLHYEEALRVPCVVAGPGIEAGQRPDALVSLLDLVPTLADLCGVALDVAHAGVSFAPALRGEAESWAGREHVLSESFKVNGTESGHGDVVDLAAFDLERDGANVSVRTATHRYIWRLHDHDELYDLTRDPWELVNLAREPDPEQAALICRCREVIAASLEADLPRVAAHIREPTAVAAPRP